MSIQDIANIVNTLNRNLVKLAQQVERQDRKLEELELRIETLERKAGWRNDAPSSALVQIEEATP